MWAQPLVLDVLLPYVTPPLLGILFGLLDTHRVRASVAGALGGTAGAWVGIAFYRYVYLPSNMPNPAIYAAGILLGVCLGATCVTVLTAALGGAPRRRRHG